MSQIHKQFTDDQTKVLLEGYCQGQLSRAEVRDVLTIGGSQFFKLLKATVKIQLRLRWHISVGRQAGYQQKLRLYLAILRERQCTCTVVM